MNYAYSQIIIGLSILVVLVPGCAEPRGSISGKVTYKDKAVPGGTVVFISDEGKVDRALIQPDGTYSSSTVPLGNLKVGVEPGEKSANAMLPKDASKGAKVPGDKVPSVYEKKGTSTYVDIPEALRTPATSNITVKVEGGAKVFDIQLKDVK